MRQSNIRTALACLLLAPISVLAQLPGGIQLENSTFDGQDASGTCGPAKVEITGVDADNTTNTPHLIRDYGATVRIQSAGKTLVVGDGGTSAVLLQNQNKLHCVATPQGPRLVVAAHCLSNYCLPISYTVIDPATLHVISQNVDGECDEQCASKALGSPLPVDLSRSLNGS